MTREEAREALSVLKIYDAQWLREAVDMAIEALQTDVVRCKDCRHLYNKDFCSFFGSPTDAMDYCSHGEMWTNGEKGEEVNGFKSVGQAWNTSKDKLLPKLRSKDERR